MRKEKDAEKEGGLVKNHGENLNQHRERIAADVKSAVLDGGEISVMDLINDAIKHVESKIPKQN